MRYRIFRTVSIYQSFGILTFSTFKFLPVKHLTLQNPVQAMQYMQKSAELHGHLKVLTLSHGPSDLGSWNSRCLPVRFHRLPKPASSHKAIHKHALITRGERDLRVPLHQAGNHSSTEAASKAAKAITSKEGQTGQPSGTHLCCPSLISSEYKYCPHTVTTWWDCPIASSHKWAFFSLHV